MRILIAGASGFLGTRLAGHLRDEGHEVLRLVRREPKGADEIRWAPAAGQLDPARLVGVDTVINLAGAGVNEKRWDDRYKNLLRTSRVDTTTTLATTIANLPEPDRPKALLNSSAIGWYGDTGAQPVEEDVRAGNDFLADLCRVWEAATRPAEDAGVRVVRLRTGLPLHRSGGLLKPLLIPFRLGVGGKLGSGRQYIPWISMHDWLAAVLFLLDRPDLAGPVNLTGPAPVTNAEFTRALGAALHRPALTFVPAVALRVALGEFAVEALKSARVIPGVLSRAGFRWRDPDVGAAIRAALTEP